MQDKEKCYKKIYCCFDENGKDRIELLKDSFVDYLKNEENREQTLEKASKES